MAVISARIQSAAVSTTMRLSDLAKKLESDGKPIFAFVGGVPDFDTEEHVKDAGIQAIRDNFLRYTQGSGLPELRQALADKLREQNGLDYPGSQVVVAPGTKPLIGAAILALSDVGSEGIVPSPYWVSYPELMRISGVTPVFVPADPEKGFRLQPEALEAAITPRTRLMMLNSPNNPTGTIYSKEDLAPLVEVLKRHPDVWVVTDDIYEHLCFSGAKAYSIASFPEIADRVVVINGFSKGYAMSGWRLGFAAGPKAAMDAIGNVIGHFTGSTNSISQKAAMAVLKGDQEFLSHNARDYEARRDLSAAAINQMPGLSCRLPEGAFYLYVDCAGVIGKKLPDGKVIETDEDFVEGMIEHAGVVVVPGSAFGMSPYFRLSYSSSPENLKAGLEKMRRFCNALV